MKDIAYKRVLLKLSGEALAGERKNGVDAETLGKICDKIKEIVDMGVEVSIVVGGGNFWRGRYGHQMERTTSDYMGMLATTINGLALQDALEARGIKTRLQTAIEMREITVTLKRKGNTYTIHKAEKEDTVTEDEFKAGEVTLINHELVLNIKDIPIMNLGGIVWTEKIKTDKTTSEINNQYDGEKTDEALAGIKVNLYKHGKKVTDTTSSDGNKKAIYTDHKGNKVEVDLAKGEYMFKDITAGDDYYVVFEYDGIKYQAMTNSKEQAYTTDARDTKISEELKRREFNENT